MPFNKNETAGASAFNLSTDTTPELGGDLDGQGFSVTNSPIAVSDQTGTTYTLALADASKMVAMSNASAITLTVPANATVPFDLNTVITVMQKGAGVVTVSPAGGVTVNNRQAHTGTADQWAILSLIKIGTDEWLMTGDTA